MTSAVDEQKKAVACGHWPLYRYNPDLVAKGANPLVLDSKEPTISFEEYAFGENRYRVLKKNNPEAAAELIKKANQLTARKFSFYEKLAAMAFEQVTDK
jgi:pyruvate-ferredoxin/flavodoxin oxidoreductase